MKLTPATREGRIGLAALTVAATALLVPGRPGRRRARQRRDRDGHRA